MIFVTGDTHIPYNIHKLNTEKFPKQKDLTKDDYVIILGDFGGVWDNSRSDMYWRKWLDNKNFTTLFIDGNHENFDLLKKFPEEYKFNGRVGKISDSIYHLKRGEIYTIENKKFFCMGGASSTDIQYRKLGVSYWNDEIPNNNELYNGISNLIKNNYKVDYILTHCAPNKIQKNVMLFCVNNLPIIYTEDKLTKYLQYIYNKCEFKHWYCGHYHSDAYMEENFTILFDDIIQLT